MQNRFLSRNAIIVKCILMVELIPKFMDMYLTKADHLPAGGKIVNCV